MMAATRIEYRIGNYSVQQCTTSRNVIISKFNSDAPNALKHLAHVEQNRPLTKEVAEQLLEDYLKISTVLRACSE